MTEKDRIVAWLRSAEFNTNTNYGAVLANRIERGEYLKRPEPTIPTSEWLPKSNLTY